MEINYAFFCDAATADSDHKINVLGILEKLYFNKFPSNLHKITFVLSINTGQAIPGLQHQSTVQLLDPEGKQVIAPATFNFTSVEEGSKNLIINIENIKFEKPGRYSMSIDIDGYHIKSINLSINKKIDQFSQIIN